MENKITSYKDRFGNIVHTYRELNVSSIFSPDDGGFYAEVWNARGKTLHSTDITGSHSQAQDDGFAWIDKYLEE